MHTANRRNATVRRGPDQDDRKHQVQKRQQPVPDEIKIRHQEDQLIEQSARICRQDEKHL